MSITPGAPTMRCLADEEGDAVVKLLLATAPHYRYCRRSSILHLASSKDRNQWALTDSSRSGAVARGLVAFESLSRNNRPPSDSHRARALWSLVFRACPSLFQARFRIRLRKRTAFPFFLPVFAWFRSSRRPRNCPGGLIRLT
jgi:hypothetical protein